MPWYFAEHGKQVGPLSEADFDTAVRAGRVAPDTLVWRDGMKDWTPYGQTLADAAPGPAPEAAPETAVEAATGVCAECGQSFPLADMIAYDGVTVCAACKPTFFQRVQEGAAIPGVVEYGGFWHRFLAKFLDGLIMGAVNMALTFMTIGLIAKASGSPARTLSIQVATWVVQWTLTGLYYVFFHGRFGATPGKMALRLKVIRSDGSPLTYGRAFGRYFGDMLSQITLYIGYIMAAFDDEKRALHDRICDTRVIRVQQ